jgi:hypothetical protein
MSVFQRHPVLTLGVTILLLLIPLDLLAGRVFIEQIPGESSTYYHHGLKRYFSGMTSWGPLRIHMYTNSLGFKDKSTRNVPLKPDRRRIVFIGDSFTEGIGIPYEQTFVGRIDSAVSSGSCEVLDAGVKSGFPKIHYLRIKQLVDRGFRFDELNVFIDISDTKDEVAWEDFQAHDPTVREQLSAISQYLSDKSVIYSFLLQPLMSKAVHRAGVATTVDGAVSPQMEEDKSKWTYDDAVFNSWGAKGLALGATHMKELSDLCRSIGARMRVAVYPWPDQILHRDLDSRQVEFWKAFCAREHVDFVDYFPDFIAGQQPKDVVQKYYINGDYHWNDAGHSLVARKWMEVVDPSLAAQCGRQSAN